MAKEAERRGDFTCHIEPASDGSGYIGIFRYRTIDSGAISGGSSLDVRSQFNTICDMIDEGAQLRGGVVMTGYHNQAFQGDVLLVDGEVIGSWKADEEEWCYFTPVGASKHAIEAPSPWMLHDLIIEDARKAE
ncbi:hypothetical protein [Pseudooceanicola sp.]|uniref:hypothetical protein n=2 Tax=Pseudooceanicola sp. TaxID=1914328 RepID=UPI0035C662CF